MSDLVGNPNCWFCHAQAQMSQGVSRKFRIVNSPKFQGNRFVTLARPSHDSLAKYFGEKNRIKFLNLFKTFATSSRLMKILTTLTRMATDFAKQSPRRNSHASEILALGCYYLFQAHIGCHDILMLGSSPIKPDMTIVVDWDAKPRLKQTKKLLTCSI